jgi:hypothetical protein
MFGAEEHFCPVLEQGLLQLSQKLFQQLHEESTVMTAINDANLIKPFI